jgi:1-phosphofructokinase family hexose kinase
MILTVTSNSALDKVLFIDQYSPGRVHPVDRVVYAVGGKGLDSSVTLSCLDVKTTGLVFVAGHTGKKLIWLIEDFGIKPEPIWVEGETRLAHVISETSIGRHTHIISGNLIINDHQQELFLSRLKELTISTGFVICAGSMAPDLPIDFYSRIVLTAHEAGKPILIDSRGTPFLKALKSKPEILKMNQHELGETFDVNTSDLKATKLSAEIVYNKFQLDTLVITCGFEAILVLHEMERWQAIVPRLEAVNAAGAGDAVSAAIAWRRSIGDTWQETLFWAAAISAAVVLTPGTAECRNQDVMDLLNQVDVVPF